MRDVSRAPHQDQDLMPIGALAASDSDSMSGDKER